MKSIKICLVAYEGGSGNYQPTRLDGFGLAHAFESKADMPKTDAEVEAWLLAQLDKIKALRDS